MDGSPRCAVVVVPDRSDGVLCVALRGELDVADADAVRARLLALVAAHPRMCLDLNGLRFLDARGLSAIEAASLVAGGVGGALSVTATSRFQRRLFEIAGLDHLLEPALDRAEVRRS